MSCTHLAGSDERLAEMAEILAAGLMRLRARKSSQLAAGSRDSSLDFSVHRSVHAASSLEPLE
jgi:hypothetical protein